MKSPCKECLIKTICIEVCIEAQNYFNYCDEQLKYYEKNIKTTDKPKDFFKQYLQAYINFREIFSPTKTKDVAKGLYHYYKCTSSLEKDIEKMK
jgi:hypothetical protein